MKKDLKTALTNELAELSQKQSDALRTATYLPMSKVEAKAFDARSKRIGEIGRLLAQQVDGSAG